MSRRHYTEVEFSIDDFTDEELINEIDRRKELNQNFSICKMPRDYIIEAYAALMRGNISDAKYALEKALPTAARHVAEYRSTMRI